MIFDDDLKFNAHVLSIINKLLKYIFILYKMRNYFDRNKIQQEIQMYNSLIFPDLIYFVSCSGGAHKSIIKSLQVIQYKFIRIMHDVNNRTFSDPLYQL